MELNAGRGPAFPQTPLSAFLLSLVPMVGQVGREEGGLGMLSGSGPSPSLLAPNHPAASVRGLQNRWLPLEHCWDAASCSWGVKPSSSHGEEREAERKWRTHLLLTRCCLVTNAFCQLPLLVAPDGSMWLLKINHPPGREAGKEEKKWKWWRKRISLLCQPCSIMGVLGEDPCHKGGKGSYLLSMHAERHSWLLLLAAGSSSVMNRG